MAFLRNVNNRFLFVFTIVSITLVSVFQFGIPYVLNQANSETLTGEMTEIPLFTPNDNPSFDISWQVPPSFDDEPHITYIANDNTLWVTPLDQPENKQQLTHFAVYPHSVIVTERGLYFRSALYNRLGDEHWLYDFSLGNINQLNLCHQNELCGWASISPDGNQIAIYSWLYETVEYEDSAPRRYSRGSSFDLYDVQDNTISRNFGMIVAGGNISDISRDGMIIWSPDSSQVIALTNISIEGEVLSIFNVETNTSIDTIQIPGRGEAPLVSNDGQAYIYAEGIRTPAEHRDGIQVWSTGSHSLLFANPATRTDTHRLYWYRPLDWHPNNQQVVVWEAWQNIETNTLVYSLNIHDIASGNVISVIEHEAITLSGAEFSADGSMLLVSRNDQISIYDFTTINATILPITGTHAQWVHP